MTTAIGAQPIQFVQPIVMLMRMSVLMEMMLEGVNRKRFVDQEEEMGMTTYVLEFVHLLATKHKLL
jgi:predicted lipase